MESIQLSFQLHHDKKKKRFYSPSHTVKHLMNFQVLMIVLPLLYSCHHPVMAAELPPPPNATYAKGLSIKLVG